jgi:hypothetical protein
MVSLLDLMKRTEQTPMPVTGKIAVDVLLWFRSRGAYGGTDHELTLAFPDAPESSYRKRRTELTQKGLLRDSGRTRKNAKLYDQVVWVVA